MAIRAVGVVSGGAEGSYGLARLACTRGGARRSLRWMEEGWPRAAAVLLPRRWRFGLGDGRRREQKERQGMAKVLAAAGAH